MDILIKLCASITILLLMIVLGRAVRALVNDPDPKPTALDAYLFGGALTMGMVILLIAIWS